ncbi:nitrate- and nitrite sensing domain-containing protein [Streptomyces sp. NPDC006879]|uniref:sensor histidine kinase n=1 Tax=Streptomyces sp. NPDC006879 TaxID=3364767 RepID=UPI00369B42A0
MPVLRSRLKPRTVRAKIISLLVVPILSLLCLWTLAAAGTAQDVGQLNRLHDLDAQVRGPVGRVIVELQAERRAAVRYATAPDVGRGAELEQQGLRSGTAVAELRTSAGRAMGQYGSSAPEVASRLRDFVATADSLAPLREDITARRTDSEIVYERYTQAIGVGFAVGAALSGGWDPELGVDARALLEFERAAEMLSREDALLSAGYLGQGLRPSQLRRFIGTVELRRTLSDTASADLPDRQQGDWQAVTSRGSYAALVEAEDAVVAASSGRRALSNVPADAWDSAHGAISNAMGDIAGAARTEGARRAHPLARGLLTTAGAAVVLGLAAVAASLFISVRIGRALVAELVSLRDCALDVARRKLPDAMRRLREGKDVEVAAEVASPPPGGGEIAQVGEALATVHRAALDAAVERAELANGVSGVFVNLARRSQVLVHRQLNLLDAMERRADDPDELGDLFRLDHLTTRMRRHAESLIILSGAAPGRAWRTPVGLTTIVRAAVSEIEDYARVEVRRLPEAAVAGAAVADLTHLLAELIENATQFSPPHTKVRVCGEPVANGYALEVEDRGLGMGRESMERANQRIGQTEGLDLFDSDRLGLFVVSRLSARHDIKVHLRASPYGGTTAVVLLPTALLQMGQDQTSVPPSAPVPEGAVRRQGCPPDVALFPQEGPDQDSTPSRLYPAAEGPAVPRTDDGASPPPPQLGGSRTTTVSSATAAPHPTGVATTTTELPRRVRQRSLVPQLRQAPDTGAEPGEAKSPGKEQDLEQGLASRTPEQARDRMAAYRTGWIRGAADARTEGGSQ